MITSLECVNRLDDADFVDAFGEVAEHSPWVAARAARQRPFENVEGMIRAFAGAIVAASHDRQLALVRAHPDLAGRAAVAGDLTEDSRREQSGAGLDRLTPDEYRRFTTLNDRYRERFGFPFVFAVRGATRHDILAAFEQRMDSAPQAELATAIENVCRIVRFRLRERVKS